MEEIDDHRLMEYQSTIQTLKNQIQPKNVEKIIVLAQTLSFGSTTVSLLPQAKKGAIYDNGDKLTTRDEAHLLEVNGGSNFKPTTIETKMRYIYEKISLTLPKNIC